MALEPNFLAAVQRSNQDLARISTGNRVRVLDFFLEISVEWIFDQNDHALVHFSRLNTQRQQKPMPNRSRVC